MENYLATLITSQHTNINSRRNKHHNVRSKKFKLLLENIKDYYYEPRARRKNTVK